MRSLVLGLAIGLVACTAEPIEGEPPIYKYSEITSAIDEARGTLDVFWTDFDAKSPDNAGHTLWVRTPSKAYTIDYVEVSAIQKTETGFVGTIPSYHEGDDGLKPGTEISFTVEDIIDWRFRDGDRFRGAYTGRARLELVPAGTDISNIRAIYHDNPLPE